MSPLNINDPFWLRLWIWRNKGNTVSAMPALLPEELETAGLPADPWPLPNHINRPQVRVPDDAPKQHWSPITGGSRTTQVFESDELFLHVITSNVAIKTIIDRSNIYKTCGTPAPLVVAQGANWMATKRIEGEHPTKPGPWIQQLGDALQKLQKHQELIQLLDTWKPNISTLEMVLEQEVFARVIEITEKFVGHATVSHGDLHTKNILVDKQNNLTGIIDLEAMTLAPPERDVVVWLTTLSGQMGLETTRELLEASNITPNPAILTTCLIHSTNKAAASAIKRLNPEPYMSTTKYLLNHLLDNPEEPTQLLKNF